MTVKELIDKLKELDPNWKVRIYTGDDFEAPKLVVRDNETGLSKKAIHF